MALTTTDVARLAALARIALSPDEAAKLLAPQLDVIADAVAQVTEVAGDDVPPGVARAAIDQRVPGRRGSPSLLAEAVLAVAPAVEDDRFRVPCTGRSSDRVAAFHRR
ncbi:MAG: Asp-tRNA(Asn)/Glu-tRNA(Gln) amidotransferase subunit GatC [Micropruina glycogenica]